MAKNGKYYKLQAELLSSGLTPRAMVLYAVLADRAELSKSNSKFRDATGIYIIFPITDLCEALGIGERTVRYAMAELEDAGLIATRKQGKSLPQKIYVHAPSERQEIAAQDRQKIATLNNNTDSTYPDYLSSSGRAGSGRGLVKLIGLIDSIAAAEKIELDDDQVYKLIKKVRKQGQKIGNLQGWLRAAIRNADILPKTSEEPEGYAPTYDIEEYERTNIFDEE